ncbi:MAG: nuclear transport factor 2 family protein [Actinomycetota bacterium]|nr:nuclear transport factor 2 family protein [Actinomycetota bacterium]
MGEARQVEDRLTDALNGRDLDGIASCYAADAVLVDPLGIHAGTDQIIESWRQLIEAFPDAVGTVEHKYESGDTAIDEWTWVGTNSGPLTMPTGEQFPATGRRVNLRGADVATVQDGVITSHRIYFDQMEFLGQLGLVPTPRG